MAGAMKMFTGADVVPLNVVFPYPGTHASIPTGYTRETGMDGLFAKLIPTTATNPGSTGGAATHDHPANGGATHTHPYPAHSHTWSATSSTNHNEQKESGANSTELGNVNHTHSVSDGGHSAISTDGGGATTWNSANLDPAHLVVIFIKSSGTHQIPNGVLAYFNGAAPTGFAEYVDARDRLLKGAAAAGDGGATAGVDSHTHALASHDHARASTAHTHTNTFSTDNNAFGSSGSNTGFNACDPSGHGHASAASSSDAFAAGSTGSAGDTSGSGDLAPPWKKLLTIENTSGVAKLPVNIIGIWIQTLASIPTKWALLDGNGGRPDYSTGQFLRGANGSAQNGNTGGALTHTHGAGSHSHTDSTGHTHTGASTGAATGTAVVVGGAGGGNEIIIGNSTSPHSGGGASGSGGPTSTSATSISAAANSSNNPSYKEVALIQYVG